MIYKVENGKVTGTMSNGELRSKKIASKTDTVIQAHHATLYRFGDSLNSPVRAVRVHESARPPVMIGRFI